MGVTFPLKFQMCMSLLKNTYECCNISTYNFVMDTILSNWIILKILNQVFTLFGLILPIREYVFIPTDNSKKITGIVVFFIVCLSFLSLNGIYCNSIEDGVRLKVTMDVIFLIVKTGLCISIVCMRAMQYDELQKFFSILKMKCPQPDKLLLSKRNFTEKIVMKNLYFVLKIVMLAVITSSNIYVLYSVYKINFIYYIFEILLYILLVFECWIVATILKIMKTIAEGLKETATEAYADFYRVPPADLKKTENGDFVVVGWLTEALNFRRDKQNILLMKNLSNFIVYFKDSIDIFNRVFGISISALILYFVLLFADICVSFNALEDCNGLIYVDIARELFLVVRK